MKQHYFSKRLENGMGIIEVIVAMAIFVIIAVSAVSTVIYSYTVNRLGKEETQASVFAQEGIEAVRSIKNRDWDNPFLSVDCTSGCGLDSSSGRWEYSGTSNLLSISSSREFERTITITPAQKDASGNVVDSGGIVDPDTYKVSSLVTWDFTPSRNNRVELITYLTRWEKQILDCSWPTVELGGSYDFPSNSDGLKIQYQQDYVYVVLDDNGNPPYDFAILNVVDPQNPLLSGSLSIDGSPTNVYVSGSYAYVSTSDDSREFQIIDISDPASPLVRSEYDVSGNSDGSGVFFDGNYAYLVKTGDSSNPEFFIIDVSNPDNPQLVGAVDIGSNNRGGLEVWVEGGFAYIASEDQRRELKIIDISNPYSPQYLAGGGYNVSGNNRALTIDGYGKMVAIGVDDGIIYFLNVIDPLSVTLISQYVTNDSVNDVAIGYDYELVFEVSNSNVNDEFQVINIKNIFNPQLEGVYDTQNTSRGIAYNQNECVSYSVGDSDPEFIILVPQTGPTPTPTPGPTSCQEFCIGSGYTDGICRRNAQQCSQNGETYGEQGDQYCTGGPSADTCCCVP